MGTIQKDASGTGGLGLLLLYYLLLHLLVGLWYLLVVLRVVALFLGLGRCVTENGVSSNFPTLDGFVGVEDLIPSSLQLLDKGGTQPVGTALVTDESNMFVVLDEAGIREVENGTTANGTAVELVTLPDDLFDEPKHGGADLIAEIAVDFSLAPPQISTSPLGPSQTGNVKSGGKGLSSKGGGGRKSRR